MSPRSSDVIQGKPREEQRVLVFGPLGRDGLRREKRYPLTSFSAELIKAEMRRGDGLIVGDPSQVLAGGVRYLSRAPSETSHDSATESGAVSTGTAPKIVITAQRAHLRW